MKKLTTTQTTKNNKMQFFSFSTEGDFIASPSLDYLPLTIDSQFDCYTPPINRQALARLPFQNAQHSGILHSRANMVSSDYMGGAVLSRMDMRALCLNLTYCA